jgi:hypothetical protein
VCLNQLQNATSAVLQDMVGIYMDPVKLIRVSNKYRYSSIRYCLLIIKTDDQVLGKINQNSYRYI